MTPDEAIRSVVRDELASLGGHLLAKYGGAPLGDDGTPNPLGTLGGYLLEQYGQARGSTTLVAEVPPWRSDESLTASDIAYRDPEPPAVGEPPNTTPAPDTEPGT